MIMRPFINTKQLFSGIFVISSLFTNMNALKDAIDENKYISESKIPNIKGYLSHNFYITDKTEITVRKQKEIMHDPLPFSYAICKGSQKSLKSLLDIAINKVKMDLIEIYSSSKSLPGIYYPLIHLALITKQHKCLKVLIEFLQNDSSIMMKVLNEITDQNHCLAIEYALDDFNAFTLLLEKKADIFTEVVYNDKSNTQIRKASPYANLLFSENVSLTFLASFIKLVKQNQDETYQKLKDNIEKSITENWYDNTGLVFSPNTEKAKPLDEYDDQAKVAALLSEFQQIESKDPIQSVSITNEEIEEENNYTEVEFYNEEMMLCVQD
ncbi:hypothetical protein TRFO_09517 [Tritrichomonas foetus]|uniref:Uncharacterized protein n=1 Tax=Tritrichomonas foetus TaxID=1144522 RepID=A0A1J4JF04_9EUKA|nr:hypothetical protein TRFO_09517 [Tritrichomonas foetus]|eukprot:OHS97257.1 hypothetical protein TRFO_09517 [Tritrichomonas foetus]